MMNVVHQLDVCPATGLLVKKDGKSVKIVLAESQVAKHLKMAHDNNGHGGVEAVSNRLSGVWWPTRNSDIHTYVRS